MQPEQLLERRITRDVKAERGAYLCVEGRGDQRYPIGGVDRLTIDKCRHYPLCDHTTLVGDRRTPVFGLYHYLPEVSLGWDRV